MNHTLISGEIVSATDKSLLIDVEGLEVWIPKSQIDSGNMFCEFSKETEFWVATWFCEKEGLI